MYDNWKKFSFVSAFATSARGSQLGFHKYKISNNKKPFKKPNKKPKITKLRYS